MPRTKVFLFRRANGIIPLMEWLNKLERREPDVHKKCLQRILNLGFTKEKEVPPQEIARGKESRRLVIQDWKKHTAEWDT